MKASLMEIPFQIALLILYSTSPTTTGSAGGMAGFVRANGSIYSNQSGEGDIRRALIEADLADCMVAVPVCLWFLAKNKAADAKRTFRDRRKQTLFIDARKMGTLIDRVDRELTDADLGENRRHAPSISG